MTIDRSAAKTLPDGQLAVVRRTRYDRRPVAQDPVPVVEFSEPPRLGLMMLVLSLMSGSGVLSALRPELPLHFVQLIAGLVAR